MQFRTTLQAKKETGMAKARVATGLVASCLLLWGPAAPAWAQQAGDPRVAGILNYRPGQEGIVCSTPTAEEAKACTVEVFKGSRPNSSGYVLRDAQGRIVRKFFDRNGDRKIDLLSYYKD